MFIAPPPLIESEVPETLGRRFGLRQGGRDRTCGQTVIVGWNQDGPIRLSFARFSGYARPVFRQPRRRVYDVQRGRSLDLSPLILVPIRLSGWIVRTGLWRPLQRARKRRRPMNTPRC